MTSSENDAMDRLRAIPEFVSFAQREMADHSEFWINTSKFGTGFMKACAIAVCKIGNEVLSNGVNRKET